MEEQTRGDMSSEPSMPGIVSICMSGERAMALAAGGAAAVDMKLEVPGEYVLVDHALSRAARRLVDKLVVSGENLSELFQSASPATAEVLHSEHSAH